MASIVQVFADIYINHPGICIFGKFTQEILANLNFCPGSGNLYLVFVVQKIANCRQLFAEKSSSLWAPQRKADSGWWFGAKPFTAGLAILLQRLSKMVKG